MRVLDADEVDRELGDLPGWTGSPEALRRTTEAPDFMTAIRIVDDVATVAEEMDHHPDIDIRWRTLHWTLSTHVAHGVTRRDIALAHRIEEVAKKYGAG
jgi:4a-hydroxytetrahydrobiopterin dehydratase